MRGLSTGPWATLWLITRSDNVWEQTETQRGTLPGTDSDPLTEALRAVDAKLDPALQPLISALIAGESAEAAWEKLIQGILDET